ncbi:MAG: hypothetical protein R2822_11845 [Spirosomataceae bacterium]
MLGEEVTSSELLAFATRLSELLKARTSALKWLFYGDKKYIKTIADKYSLSLEINDLYQLQAYLQHRQGWEAAIRPIEEDWRIELLSERYSVSKSNLDDFMEAISKAQIALNAPHVAFLSVLIERSHDFSSFQKSVYELLDFAIKPSKTTSYGDVIWHLPKSMQFIRILLLLHIFRRVYNKILIC